MDNCCVGFADIYRLFLNYNAVLTPQQSARQQRSSETFGNAQRNVGACKLRKPPRKRNEAQSTKRSFFGEAFDFQTIYRRCRKICESEL